MSGLGPGFRGTFWPGDTQELYIGASGVRNPSLSGYCQFPKWLHRLTPPQQQMGLPDAILHTPCDGSLTTHSHTKPLASTHPCVLSSAVG